MVKRKTRGTIEQRLIGGLSEDAGMEELYGTTRHNTAF